MNNGRIERLDLFRGCAAIVVVLFHFGEYLGVTWVRLGFLAVDLFFILSGIVLSLRYAKAIEDGMPFFEFAKTRLQRLYPMALISGIFVVVLNLTNVPAGVWVTAERTSVWTLFALTPQPVVELSAFPPNGPAWSLWAELASNFVWFAALRVGKSAARLLLAGSFAGFVFLAWQHQGFNFGIAGGLVANLEAIVRALGWFGVGYLIATKSTGLRLPTLPILGAFIGALAIAVASGREGWRISLGLVLLGALLLRALLYAPPPAQWLATLGRALGTSSYPLYMIHAPAGRLLPVANDMLTRHVLLLFVIGATTIVATLLNERIVQWLRRRPRRYASETG